MAVQVLRVLWLFCKRQKYYQKNIIRTRSEPDHFFWLFKIQMRVFKIINQILIFNNENYRNNSIGINVKYTYVKDRIHSITIRWTKGTCIDPVTFYVKTKRVSKLNVPILYIRSPSVVRGIYYLRGILRPAFLSRILMRIQRWRVKIKYTLSDNLFLSHSVFHLYW